MQPETPIIPDIPPDTSPKQDYVPGGPIGPERPKRLLDNVMLRVFTVVIVIASIAGIVYALKSPSKITPTPKKSDDTSYYVAPNKDNGLFVYLASGRQVSPLDGSTAFVTEYLEGSTHFTVSQSSSDKLNPCAKSTDDSPCDLTYQTTKGNTVQRRKEGGVYVKLGNQNLYISSEAAQDPSRKAGFDAFIDSLVPVQEKDIVKYNQQMRSLPGWKQYYAFGFPIYTTTNPPNSLALVFQDKQMPSSEVGGGAYFATTYSNQAAISVQNTGTTYKFSYDQYIRPADFSPTGNCVAYSKKYTCVEITAVGSETVDKTKYRLYKTKESDTLLIADFGKSLIVASTLAPLRTDPDVTRATNIRSLNAMKETPINDVIIQTLSMHKQL